MTPLVRALIEKAGHDHGFEFVAGGDAESVSLGSARHPAAVRVKNYGKNFWVDIESAAPTLAIELKRSFSAYAQSERTFVLPDEAALCAWLSRAAMLSQALPNQAATDYEAEVQATLSGLSEAEISSTEVQRVVRQRIGQDRFRKAMLDYWGGACAVTGLTVAAALRASHAKPWADCGTDAERLDVFNGFLLSANFDALFDKFLITFDVSGGLLISPKLSLREQTLLGLHQDMKVRWITEQHQSYLEFHRARFRSEQ